ncbi:hypothetical protein JW935_19875 [candidate division KSB1 bacterium]|nr:hypothetical protein [candidate division KSB1 bacterium]
MNHSENNTREIDLYDYFKILVVNRRLILRNFIFAVVGIILVAFLLPKKYTAVTTLMPPVEQEGMSMSSMLSEVAVPGLSLPTGGSSSDVLYEILKSRTVATRVLGSFYVYKGDSLSLDKILGVSSVEKGLKKLARLTSFTLSKQGLITVLAECDDPKLAAAVANTFVAALDHVNQEKSVSRAKNSRLYIESQLYETRTELQEATKKLAEFQREHKTIALEEQTRASIEQAGELKGEIIAKRAQLQTLRMTLKQENPRFIRLQREIDELEKEYANLQYGTLPLGGDKGEFYVPLADVPEVGVQLAELLRDVKVQETVWSLLNQQYYQAKIDEARDTPTVQVLDPAVPPERPNWPRKGLLAVIFGLLSLILSVLFVFGREYYRHLQQNPQGKKRLDGILDELKKDWRFLRGK